MRLIQAAILSAVFVSGPTWADCLFLAAKNCAQIQVTQILQKGTGEICVAKTEQKSPGKTSEILTVFFKTCPKPGLTMTGDLMQRSDITIEGMASCQYEFKPNKTCEPSLSK